MKHTPERTDNGGAARGTPAVPHAEAPDLRRHDGGAARGAPPAAEAQAPIHTRADITARLLALREPDFQAFQAKLIPSRDPETVLGVRTPALRALARELAGTDAAADFLAALPHRYFEEDNLHAFLLARIRSYDACISALDAFLPHIDNWATCDQLSPGALGRDLSRLDGDIRRWLASPLPYVQRFGIGMRMRHFLGAAFTPDSMAEIAAIRSDEYYVNMMIAWYFATALAMQEAAALPYFEAPLLPRFVRGKAIQKALESRRVSPETKAYLRTRRQQTGGCHERKTFLG